MSARRIHPPHGDGVVIKVQDTGIGIAGESLPALFEKFSVAEDASTSKYGGTGLGLALSLKLCKLMGGGISVDSDLGIGSCFTIKLPSAPPKLVDPESPDGVASSPSPERSGWRDSAPQIQAA